jgi:hypothetical protein
MEYRSELLVLGAMQGRLVGTAVKEPSPDSPGAAAHGASSWEGQRTRVNVAPPKWATTFRSKCTIKPNNQAGEI